MVSRFENAGLDNDNNNLSYNTMSSSVEQQRRRGRPRKPTKVDKDLDKLKEIPINGQLNNFYKDYIISLYKNRKITRYNAVEKIIQSFTNNIKKSANTFQNVLKKYDNKTGVKEKREKVRETQLLNKADKVIKKTKTQKQIKASNKIIRLYKNTLKFKIVNKQQAFKNKVEQITLTPSILGSLSI